MEHTQSKNKNANVSHSVDCMLYTSAVIQKPYLAIFGFFRFKNPDFTMPDYRKTSKISDTWKNGCNYPKIGTVWFYYRVMGPKDTDGMANSVDPDQTAPLGAVWSRSTLFAQTCLSENLGSLLYLLQDSQSITVFPIKSWRKIFKSQSMVVIKKQEREMHVFMTAGLVSYIICLHFVLLLTDRHES